MERDNYELPFDKRLSSFSSITIWDRPSGLETHIKQLNTSKKEYSIEKRKGLIRVWSERRVGIW